MKTIVYDFSKIRDVMDAPEIRTEEREVKQEPVTPDDPTANTPPGVIDALFMAGVNQCMRDEETGSATECHYASDTLMRHWWTRGYAYQARAFRAVELESWLKVAEERIKTLEAANASWKRYHDAGSAAHERAEKAEARAEAAEKQARNAQSAIKEAYSYLADMHDEDAGCSFTLDIDAEDSDVGCLSCLAQLALAEGLSVDAVPQGRLSPAEQEKEGKG